ncbi:hypothetical protein GCM10011390_43870 [Aureimonas endophytica]|uniref:Flagellar hook-length control protein-like C-terminal domain-containing protein n=1 Tax=Aureimonas endophytica TaxID=2027858 RepID=A0A917A0C5_9HYPH|nr:flagellar hook-length control protein FliK [Aureimonas endophytica]GGE19829.1 hypothetical protein GCM10011390_43870 [Aureimonas endophytica]
MIGSIISAMPTVDAGGGGAASGATSAEAGAAFGEAVRSAGEGKEQHPGAKSSHAAERKSAKAEGKPAGKGETDAKTADAEDAAAAAATPGDILGRLLGTAMFTPKPEATADAEAGKDGKSDDGLNERIVITTVVDMADGKAVGEDAKTRVSLRVLKMETHFEPHLDGATLVDAETAAKAAESAGPASATAKGAEASDAKTVRKGFEEILQTLGRPAGAGEASPDGGEGQGDAAAGEGRSSASASTKGQERSKPSGNEFGMASADQARGENGAKSTAVGQIVSTQVADHIVRAFEGETRGSGDASATTRSDAPGAQILRMTAGGAALKTLSIQLQPQDLGRLDVSMRLIDGRLSVELAASEPATAQALAGDRHTLRKLLEHAGFSLDDAAITIVARDVGQTLTAASASGTASGDTQGQPGRSGAQAGNFGEGAASGGDGNRRDDADRRPSGRPAPEERRAPAAASGNIYL